MYSLPVMHRGLVSSTSCVSTMSAVTRIRQDAAITPYPGDRARCRDQAKPRGPTLLGPSHIVHIVHRGLHAALAIGACTVHALAIFRIIGLGWRRLLKGVLARHARGRGLAGERDGTSAEPLKEEGLGLRNPIAECRETGR